MPTAAFLCRTWRCRLLSSTTSSSTTTRCAGQPRPAQAPHHTPDHLRRPARQILQVSLEVSARMRRPVGYPRRPADTALVVAPDHADAASSGQSRRLGSKVSSAADAVADPASSSLSLGNPGGFPSPPRWCAAGRAGGLPARFRFRGWQSGRTLGRRSASPVRVERATDLALSVMAYETDASAVRAKPPLAGVEGRTVVLFRRHDARAVD